MQSHYLKQHPHPMSTALFPPENESAVNKKQPLLYASHQIRRGRKSSACSREIYPYISARSGIPTNAIQLQPFNS
jgi:hypothetical protein